MLKRLLLSVIGLLFAAGLIAYVAAGWNDLPLDDNARAKAPGSFFDSTQGKIHYQWYGDQDAPVIVMTHGLARPSFVFRQNAKALADAGFRVLTFDHLGRGWSDRPAAKYDDAFYQREMLDVLDGLGLKEPVGLVGLSMGGLVASNFTANHPDRIKALLLFAPAGIDVSADRENLSRKLIKTPIVGDWIWRIFGKQILIGSGDNDGAKLKPDDRSQDDMAEQMNYEGYLKAVLSTYRHIKFHDREDVYQKLQTTDVPVAAVFGSDDTTVLPSSLGKLKKFLPRAETTMIDGATHDLTYQMPAQTSEHLVSFFRSQF